jgi:soluble lytic murein transglycosylase-like protein
MFVKQAKQESGYNPYAVSKAGAQGVFQLMPGTAKDLGVTDPFDVAQNISGGINYMGQQLNRFKDPALALAAYNAGPKRVADFGGIPNIPETQDYVKRILGG